MAQKWIQKINLKPGALRKMLKIPMNKNIPLTLLKKINKAETGIMLKNPTKIGPWKIKITPQLKKRVNLALTFNRFK